MYNTVPNQPQFTPPSDPSPPIDSPLTIISPNENIPPPPPSRILHRILERNIHVSIHALKLALVAGAAVELYRCAGLKERGEEG